MTDHRPTNGERLAAPVRRTLEDRDAPDYVLHHLDRLVEQFDKMERDVSRYRSAAAAAEVDKQRQVDAALKRAQDCSLHGQDIARLEERAEYFDIKAESNDRQRIALLALLWSLEAVVDKTERDGGDELVLSLAAVKRAVKDANNRLASATRKADRAVADSRARAEAKIRDLQGGHNG